MVCMLPSLTRTWPLQNLDHNVPHGKLNRGMSVIDSVEILQGCPLSHNEYVKAAVLGWCVELVGRVVVVPHYHELTLSQLQAYFLVADDIMDSSFTRRSRPCWYRIPTVGMIAINDSFMLEGAIYHLLKVHFKRESYYVDLLEVFHDTTYLTEMGQLIDLITAPEGDVDLGRFSMEKYFSTFIYTLHFHS